MPVSPFAGGSGIRCSGRHFLARASCPIDRTEAATHLGFVTDRSPPLPADLLAALAKVGRVVGLGKAPGAMLDGALDLLAQLPPGQVARADGAIAAAANLYYRRPPSLLGSLFSRRLSDKALLFRTPGLEYLFLFHRDGRLREAALHKITGGLPTPFLLASIQWRLNDWAAPVREAAVRCASRSFPATDPAVVARAATALLVRQASWKRWHSERAVVDKVFARDDVAEHLAGLLCRDVTGPLASVLRHALRTPALDPHLERIAFGSVQPSVRALALDALVNGRAEWPSGFVWQWVDKSMGLRRKVTVFDHRDLSIALPKEDLIARGIKDRSAVVRRVALAAVIRHFPGTPKGREYAAALLADPSPSVRERAEFILRMEAA